MHLPHTYLDENCEYFLEDESGRVKLDLTSWVSDNFDLITGICIAIKGKELDNGSFCVSDVCLPGIPPTPPPKELLQRPSLGEDKKSKIILVSGIGYDEENKDLTASLELLFEFICGNLGHHSAASEISALVIVGNFVSDPKRKDDTIKVDAYIKSLTIRTNSFHSV